MNLIENNPFYLSYYFTAPVDHVSEDFCCHDQAWCWLIDCHITSHQTHIMEVFLELSVLLVRKGFYWGCVNYSGFVPHAHRYSILGDRSFTCWCMRTYKDVLVWLNWTHCFLLEGIKRKLVLASIAWARVHFPFISFGIEYFMNASLIISLHLNLHIVKSIFIYFVITITLGLFNGVDFIFAKFISNYCWL